MSTTASVEITRREREVAEAIHSGEMEGLQTTSETRADTGQYVAGEISLTELEARVRGRYGIG